MPFLRLSDLVRDLSSRPVPAGDLRLAAAQLALERWGEATVTEQLALVNVAALAIRQRDTRPTVHQVRPAAAQLVGGTDLHALPGQPPRLLRRPFLIEARRPETGERLFGDTVDLAGYELEGAIYLIGLQYPDGVHVARWRPAWGERDLAAGVVEDQSALIDDVDAHHEWTREAARFLVVLGLLLDAEGVPLRIDDEREPVGRRGAGRDGDPPPWTVRHVYLDEVRGPRSAGDPAAPASEAAEGRIPDEVMVRGHLKRQPVGPGRAERKWIYVASYEARRWVAPRPVRVVVGTHEA